MSMHPFAPRSRVATYAVLAAWLAGAAADAGAQQRSESLQRQFRGGHRFIHNALVPSPNISSFVRASLSFGESPAPQVPIFVIGGVDLSSLQGDLLFAGMDFEYQHAVKSWIAVRARFRMIARLGNEVSSLLSAGVTASTGFELGWLVKLVRTDRLMLSGSLEVSSNKTTILDLLGFVEDVLDTVPARLVRNTPSARGGAGLRFAYGVSPLFGFTTFVSGGYGESTDRRAENEPRSGRCLLHGNVTDGPGPRFPHRTRLRLRFCSGLSLAGTR